MTMTRGNYLTTFVLLAVLAAMLAIAGCDCGPVSGAVVSKQFEPAHTERKTVAGYRAAMVVTVNHPDKWWITVRTEDGRDVTRPCSKEQHDQAVVGQEIRIE